MNITRAEAKLILSMRKTALNWSKDDQYAANGSRADVGGGLTVETWKHPSKGWVARWWDDTDFKLTEIGSYGSEAEAQQAAEQWANNRSSSSKQADWDDNTVFPDDGWELVTDGYEETYIKGDYLIDVQVNGGFTNFELSRNGEYVADFTSLEEAKTAA